MDRTSEILAALCPPQLGRSCALGSNDASVILVFVAACALFSLAHFVFLPKLWVPAFRKRGLEEEAAVVAAGVTRKVGGGLVLGFGGAAVLLAVGDDPLRSGLLGTDVSRFTMVTGVGLLTIVPGALLSALGKQSWAFYPEIRVATWPRNVAIASALGWTAYLIGFEFFFRGFLLFYLAQVYGVGAALAMTTALYTLAHLPTNGPETAICIPMGFVFGAMALYTGTMWAPFIVHLVVAVGTETVSAYRNPQVRWSWS